MNKFINLFLDISPSLTIAHYGFLPRTSCLNGLFMENEYDSYNFWWSRVACPLFLGDSIRPWYTSRVRCSIVISSFPHFPFLRFPFLLLSPPRVFEVNEINSDAILCNISHDLWRLLRLLCSAYITSLILRRVGLGMRLLSNYLVRRGLTVHTRASFSFPSGIPEISKAIVLEE